MEDLAYPKKESDDEKMECDINRMKETLTCKVCLTNDVHVLFLPCGHFICCQACSTRLRNCVLCRALIRGIVKPSINLDESDNCSFDWEEDVKSAKEILIAEYDKLRNILFCRSCNRVSVQTLFLPCRHLVACEKCSDPLTHCIRCKALIMGTVRSYLI